MSGPGAIGDASSPEVDASAPGLEGAAAEAELERRLQERREMHGSRFGDALARTLSWRPGMIVEPVVWDRFWWLRRNVRRGSVRSLDAGCGSGWFAFYLADQGNEVVGINFNEKATETAQRRTAILGHGRTSFIQGDLRELDVFGPELGSFDQIICFEVIEHILNDQKLVDDLADRLAPGGQLLLTTPADDHIPLEDEVVSPVEDGGHVRFGYSHARLRELCDAAGLRVTSEAGLTGWIGQMQWDISRRLSKLVGVWFAVALMIPFRPLQFLDGPITRLLKRPYVCVGIVAEKPA